jgi:hypothetical protein
LELAKHFSFSVASCFRSLKYLLHRFLCEHNNTVRGSHNYVSAPNRNATQIHGITDSPEFLFFAGPDGQTSTEYVKAPL